MKVLVVAGYGVTPVRNYAMETERYLLRAAELLREAYEGGDPFSNLILCGGMTQQKTSPHVTEAYAMHERLRTLTMWTDGKLVPSFWDAVLVSHEERSFTSLENVRNASERIYQLWEQFDEELHITVLCEGMRLLKWQILCRHFMPKTTTPIQYEIVNWELMSPHKELMATIWDACSVSIPIIGPAMAWWWGWRRRRRAKHI
ncbi:MAG: ElyC/SanA/YdcF family protein [Candidatus Paceibacterota bacterium]|nr:MAG: ElyC/SanA/YdcF family protein [Candidatus Paceibacterota bacterium]